MLNHIIPKPGEDLRNRDYKGRGRHGFSRHTEGRCNGKRNLRPSIRLNDKENQRSELIEENEDHDVICDNAKVNIITVSTRGSSAPNPFRKLHETGQPPTKEEMDNYLHIHPELQESPDVQYIYSLIKDQDLEQKNISKNGGGTKTGKGPRQQSGPY